MNLACFVGGSPRIVYGGRCAVRCPLLVGRGGFLRWGRAPKRAVVVEPSINTTSSVDIFLHHKMMWCEGRVSFDKPTVEPT